MNDGSALPGVNPVRCPITDPLIIPLALRGLLPEKPKVLEF